MKAVVTLTDRERYALNLYCLSHVAVRCSHCHEGLTASQIGADLIGEQRDFCPMCRTDLTDPLRWHILECSAISASLGGSIELSRLLRKQSEELTTRSTILAIESKARAERVAATLRGRRKL